MDIADQIEFFKDKPDGSIPYKFDLSNQDLRFSLEPVPQNPLGKELVVGALEILHHMVLGNEAIEFRALVVCDKIAFGRFSVRFLEGLESLGNVTVPVNVTAFQ